MLRMANCPTLILLRYINVCGSLPVLGNVHAHSAPAGSILTAAEPFPIGTLWQASWNGSPCFLLPRDTLRGLRGVSAKTKCLHGMESNGPMGETFYGVLFGASSIINVSGASPPPSAWSNIAKPGYLCLVNFSIRCVRIEKSSFKTIRNNPSTCTSCLTVHCVECHPTKNCCEVNR